MRLRARDRGLAVQVGVTILLGFIVIALATYQVEVVPQQNARVEFSHSQTVQGQLQDVRGAVVSVPGGGPGRSVAVDLGTQYPERTVFVNPPSPSGQLRTTSNSTLGVDNATASGEVGDFWNGTERNITTQALLYRPNYNVYQNGPMTVVESTVVFDEQPRSSERIVDSSQRLIDGNRITLTALRGEYQEAGSRTVSVDVTPVSSSTRVVTVRNTTDPITLTVPTDLSVATWRDDLLAAENVSQGGRVQDVRSGPRPNTVTVELEPGTYELRMAKVGLTNGVSRPGAAYLTDVEGDGASVSANRSQRLVAEVRDEYNNPVPGVETNVSFDGTQGDVEVVRNVSDAEGRVVYDYMPDSSAADTTQTVTVSFSSSPGPEQRVEFDVSVGGGSGGGGGGGGRAAYDVSWNRSKLEKESGVIKQADDVYRVDASVSPETALPIDTSPRAQNAEVDYAVNNTSIGTLASSEGTTNDAGEDSVTYTARRNGSALVYTNSGGSGDRLEVRVVNAGLKTGLLLFRGLEGGNDELLYSFDLTDDTLREYGKTSKPQAIAGAADVDDDGTVEAVYLNESNKILAVDADNASASPDVIYDADTDGPVPKTGTRMALGDYDDDGNISVLFANGSGALYRHEPTESGGTTTEIIGSGVTAVSGVADITGDGTKEVVYTTTSQNINYYNRTAKTQTSLGINLNTATAVGEPANFEDGDFEIEVSFDDGDSDGGSNIGLVNNSGEETTLGGVTDTTEAPMATANTNSDVIGPEVVFLDSSGFMKYVDVDGNVRSVLDENGDKIKVTETTYGVVGGESPR